MKTLRWVPPHKAPYEQIMHRDRAHATALSFARSFCLMPGDGRFGLSLQLLLFYSRGGCRYIYCRYIHSHVGCGEHVFED